MTLRAPVSIPQSGQRTFKRGQAARMTAKKKFQSLNRDKGRSNIDGLCVSIVTRVVSIPQSGQRTFKPDSRPSAGRGGADVSIPQSGQRTFKLYPQPHRLLSQVQGFQSLNRDKGRSNKAMSALSCGCGRVSIPQSGQRTFKLPSWEGIQPARTGFNPSIGTKDVQTRCSRRCGAFQVKFQSLNRDKGRSNESGRIAGIPPATTFQSLNRDKGRSNPEGHPPGGRN